MKKLTLLLFVTGLLHAHAQTSNREIKGDKLFDKYSYRDAIEKYRRADALTVDGYRKLAVAYTNTGNTPAAEAAYAKFVNASPSSEDYFNYAMVLKSNGKYDEADKWMKRFAAAKPNDLRAKDYIANGDKVKDAMKDNGRYNVKRLSLNTDADDFGAAFFGKKIVFASSRDASPLVDRTYNWTDKPFLDIYEADLDNGELTNVKRMTDDVNRKWHEGPAAFANNGTVMAFTRNNYDAKSKDGVVKFEIFFREFKDGKWTNEKPFRLNSPEYSVGHPWLSEDGKTMFFASDMPGGFGGSDLYRVVKNESGEWGNPENLGNAVNTEGNEMFPFYEPTAGVLFFASNGLAGLGGLDVFMAHASNGAFRKATNMGAGVNGPQDDYALILDGSMKKGFLSSNRNGAGGDDLYSVEVMKPISFTKQVNGIVKDKSGKGIPDALVVMIDSLGRETTLRTDPNGTFSFTADEDQRYTVKASKEKYNDGTATVNTATADNAVNTELVLSDKIVVGMELSKVVNVKPIFFDLGKSNIRPDAAAELDKIVAVMNENPTMVVELGSHTDCRGSAAANQKLSDARAKASAKYIQQRITNPERIYGKGYGETKLLNDCGCEGKKKSSCTEAEHQVNRRTEFVVIKM